MRISGSNAGCTMFRNSVKGTGYPPHSPVFPFTSPPVRHGVPSHFNWILLTHSPSSGCCWSFGDIAVISFGATKNYQHTLSIGTEFVTETSEKVHILRRVSARENFVVLCNRENFANLYHFSQFVGQTQKRNCMIFFSVLFAG